MANDISKSLKHPKITAFKKKKGNLTKEISRSADGTLHKDPSECYLDFGVCKTVEVFDLEHLNTTLDSLTTSMAVTYGITTFEEVSKVVSKRKANQYPDAITRTRDNFHYPNPAVFMGDYDPAPGCDPLSPDELYKILIGAMPELANIDMLWRPSASSCIYHGDKELVGISGQRFYFIVDCGNRIPEIGNLLVKRLWLNGHGRIDLSKSGTMLERCPIDTSVWQPERLDFAAGAFCKHPLERRPVPGKIYKGGSYV